MERVAFITTESGDDLIVSFAISRSEIPTDIASLTLLRTPKYEHVLYEWERGTSVSFDQEEKESNDVVLLREVTYSAAEKVVTVRSDTATYELDLRKVDPDELKQMCRVFRQMNFDASIELKGL